MAEAVDGADCPLAADGSAIRHQHLCNERQRGAGAKRCRHHDDQANDVARGEEPAIAGVALLEGVEEIRDPSEGFDVEGQRRDRERAHHPLDRAEEREGIVGAIGTAADPECSEGEAKNECREHQLERMRRAPQNQ